MSNQTILRISKEITNIQKGTDLSIAVACVDESDVRNVKALVIGPPDTPYEYGFFEFAVKFSNEYPSKPPRVDAKTTNKGRCRFNPNIYAQGKVCLSILGTWRGETSGEEWSSAQGLESILISIQSLLSGNPYENEPGYETANSHDDKMNQVAYVAKIRHETIRIAVIQKLEEIMGITSDGDTKDDSTPEWEPNSCEEDNDGDIDGGDGDDLKHASPPTTHSRKRKRRKAQAISSSSTAAFADLYKRRFLWYYDAYMTTCTANRDINTDGQIFGMMPFESSSNGMTGSFHYSALIPRLIRLKQLIDMETSDWAARGILAMERETSMANNLQRQFEQLIEHLKKNHNFNNLTLSLEQSNPFTWTLTYFGKPGTSLDGGIFRLRIALSPHFPDQQPRVHVETPIFHHRVARDGGTLCYFPSRAEDMHEHVCAMIQSLEDENPRYDPRAIVRPEASKLLWGSEAEKKRYKRLLRRSAEESVEFSFA